MLENNTENTGKIENSSTDEQVISSQESSEKELNEEHLNDSTEKDKSPQNSEEVIEENYSNFSLEELVDSLKNLLEKFPIQKLKKPIDAIKTNFNKKFGVLLAEKKQAFLADGGESIDFQFSSPIKITYNKLLSEYKSKRDAYYSQLEKKLQENLSKRNEVIEELKTLIEDAEVSTMYKKFREIQDKWKVIGPVSKTKYNDTWKIYHHHVERFYDLLHLSNDFRDVDFKNNLEEKLKIIERAEALFNEKDINYASKELQNLHKIWKEDIGPVARELREEVWAKFSNATKKIHDKRHEYFKELNAKYDDLVQKKLSVVSEIESLDYSKNSSHNDWQKSIHLIEELRNKYFALGKLPYSKSEKVWQKFKLATKKFNSEKNNFYKNEKSEQHENLRKKMALIELAESLKESEDWEMATNAMKKVQADWKTIGHVPRRNSDEIWKRFKNACNHYFDRLHQQKNAITEEEQKILDEKLAFFDTLKSEKKLTKDQVLEAINSWKQIGVLPKNSRQIDRNFLKFIDAVLANLDIDKSQIVMLKFTNLMDAYVADNNYRKLDSEQFFVRKKIDEIVREIQQLENNLSFFSISNKNNPLVVNVKNQVSDFKEELSIWKEKLNYLKKLDY